MWVSHGPVMDVLTRKIIGVFAHIQGAEENCARTFEPLDEGGVPASGWIGTVDLRSGESGKPSDIE
jgi:hypothetical protein